MQYRAADGLPHHAVSRAVTFGVLKWKTSELLGLLHGIRWSFLTRWSGCKEPRRALNLRHERRQRRLTGENVLMDSGVSDLLPR